MGTYTETIAGEDQQRGTYVPKFNMRCITCTILGLINYYDT